jgi:hypothetical protein
VARSADTDTLKGKHSRTLRYLHFTGNKVWGTPGGIFVSGPLPWGPFRHRWKAEVALKAPSTVSALDIALKRRSKIPRAASGTPCTTTTRVRQAGAYAAGSPWPLARLTKRAMRPGESEKLSYAPPPGALACPPLRAILERRGGAQCEQKDERKERAARSRGEPLLAVVARAAVSKVPTRESQSSELAVTVS